MKHLFSYIVFVFLIFNAVVANAADKYALPEDFMGTGTRAILQDYYDDEDSNKISLINQSVMMYEVGSYLYNKYTLEEIAEESFIEKLRPFFPMYNDEQLDSRRKLLYNGIEVYNYGKQKYTDIVGKYLVPHTLKTVRSDSEYDHPGEVPYMEAPEGEYIKVYNFKKFLSYSDNQDERAAIQKYEAQKNKDNVLEQFNDAMQKIEWKKVALYGIKYDNPLYSSNGITPPQKTEAGAIRLVTNGAFINGRDELEAGITAVVRPEMFVLANNLSLNLRKPQINLSQSQNIAPDYQIVYPVPLHSQVYPAVYKYTGNFMIMFKVRPIDIEKPILLRVETDMTECDYQLHCSPQHFSFEQVLEPKGDELFGNGMENYFFRIQASMPQSNLKHLTLNEFTVQKEQTKQSLFLEFESRKSVNTFNVFIEENEANTTFKKPLISLRDNKIFVRVEPTEEYAKRDLSNAEYIITANLNDKYFLRRTLVPEVSHFATALTADFDFGFFIFAFIGGLLLNFMPCVFPLWAYKLQTMYALHKKQTQIIRTDLKQLLRGILCGTVAVFGLLLIAKNFYTPYIWGVQLQNMPFVMTMLFVGLMLIKILPYVFENISRENIRFFNYALGIFGCVAAASCGAPYVSETLTSAVNDSYLILGLAYVFVVCGFCLPFMILLKTNYPQNVLKFVYQNKSSVNVLIKFALYLAIAWYLLLIYWQTGFIYTAKIMIAVAVFWFFADIFLKFLQYLNGVHDERVTPRHIALFMRGCYVVIVVLSLMFIIIASVSATHRQIKHRRITAENTVNTVDFTQIEHEIEQGNAVLVTIETDWCFSCRLNEMLVFNQPNFKKWTQLYHLKHIRVNQAKIDTHIADYMKRYLGVVRVPFYVLYTPVVQNGIVLPNRPTVESMDRLLIYNKKGNVTAPK